MRSLNIAATGMLAQQTNVEVISNNIANMNTTAYARRRAEFNDLLYQNMIRAGSASSDQGTIIPAGVQLGLGVRTAAVYRISEQGSLNHTENTFDIAINGKGYFQVQLPNGETSYTRDGSFQLDPNGTLVTHEGYTVMPGINIPLEAVGVTVNASGEVLVKLDGQPQPQNVGQITLATFANEAGLEAIGKNLFLETPGSGAPNVAAPGTPGYGAVMQGFVENSNVNVVSEITDLISAQRAYEMNSKAIKTSDEMMATVNQLK